MSRKQHGNPGAARSRQSENHDPVCFSAIDALALLSSSSHGDCSLCFEPLKFFAVGSCGHNSVCWLCSLRLRWVMNDLSCPLCKEQMLTVTICASGQRPPSGNLPSTHGVSFADERLSKACHRLLSYACVFCSDSDPSFVFKSLRDLQTHLKRDHGRSFCGICLDHRQSFICEQYLYRIEDLERHKREGDLDREPPIDAHPICEFCKGERFFTEDELREHMRKTHFACAVCDYLGWRNEYFTDYDALNAHFHESHYPCLEDDCVQNRFVVFPDEDALRVHQIESHISVKGMSRSSKRNLLTLQVQGQHTDRIHSASSTANKKKRNPHQDTKFTVHFRGPKILRNAPENIGASEMKRYPDRSDGCNYNPGVHSKLPTQRKPEKAAVEIPIIRDPAPQPRDAVDGKVISSALKEAGNLSDYPIYDSEEYRQANKSLKALLSAHLEISDFALLQSAAHSFRDSIISASAMADTIRKFLTRPNSKNLLIEIIRLTPSAELRGQLTSALAQKIAKEDGLPRRGVDREYEGLVGVVIKPDENRISFVGALFCYLSQVKIKFEKNPAMQMRSLKQYVSSLDTIQLETLAEIREHILAVEPRLSLAHAEELVSLRPLFHRLMHIPPERSGQARQLSVLGWHQFISAAEKLKVKFSDEELWWVDQYIRLVHERLTAMGTVQTARHDFPSLESLDSFRPQPVIRAAPQLDSAYDFPAALQTMDREQGLGELRGNWRQRQNVLPREVLEAESELHFPALVEVFPDRPRPQPEPQPVEEAPQIAKKKKKTVLLATGGRGGYKQ